MHTLLPQVRQNALHIWKGIKTIAPEQICLLVRVKVWVRFRVIFGVRRRGQLFLGVIFLEPSEKQVRFLNWLPTSKRLIFFSYSLHYVTQYLFLASKIYISTAYVGSLWKSDYIQHKLWFYVHNPEIFCIYCDKTRKFLHFCLRCEIKKQHLHGK